MKRLNIKKVIEYVIWILFCIIVFLVFVILFFWVNYTGKIIPNYFFYFSILGLLIVGFILFKLFGLLEEKPILIDFNDKNIIDFENWERIKVKSRDLEVISAPYYQEVQKSSNWRIQRLDSLSNEGGVKRVKIDTIYLKYSSKNRTYKQLINYKDEISLKMILSKMDYVDLWINQNDKKEYYFDLQI